MALVTPFTSPAASGAVTTNDKAGNAQTPTALLGWAFRETSGSAGAVVRIRDGGVSGRLLVSIHLDTSEWAGDFYAGEGLVLYNDALYIEVTSGSVEGAIYWG